MKIYKSSIFMLLSGIGLSLFMGVPSYATSPTVLDNNGEVAVKASSKTDPVDPENPNKTVDPGSGPSTEGLLRFDFVSTVKFGRNKITEKDREYVSLAQLFHDDTEARGSYVQITDLRGGTPGWSLQVRQEQQFRNDVIQEKKQQELAGSVLSFNNSWANSGGTSEKPSIQRDIISVNVIGEAYQVATARKGAGGGTWTINFGASDKNTAGQPKTLSPLKDETGKPVMDTEFNKPSYKNSAIMLSVPEQTAIHPVQYKTTLTWILLAEPVE